MKQFVLGMFIMYMTLNIFTVIWVIIHEWKERKNFSPAKLILGIFAAIPILIKYLVLDE